MACDILHIERGESGCILNCILNAIEGLQVSPSYFFNLSYLAFFFRKKDIHKDATIRGHLSVNLVVLDHNSNG